MWVRRVAPRIWKVPVAFVRAVLDRTHRLSKYLGILGIPLGLFTLHIAALVAWDDTARFNAYVGTYLQLFGAWWVFYTVSDQIGLNISEALIRGARDVWTIVRKGSHKNYISAGTLSVTAGVTMSARGRALPRPASTIAGKLKQLERRLDDFEKEVDGWNEEHKRQTENLRKEVETKIKDLQRDVSDKERKTEAQHRGVMKAEAAGLLVFTHGLLTSILAQ